MGEQENEKMLSPMHCLSTTHNARRHWQEAAVSGAVKRKRANRTFATNAKSLIAEDPWQSHTNSVRRYAWRIAFGCVNHTLDEAIGLGIIYGRNLLNIR